jgi:ADP-ribosyl-[dinitrogen reductase] hydrolase
MRISPMGVFLHRCENLEQIETAIRAEVSLSHGDKTVQDAAIAYVLAIKSGI